MEWTIYKPPYTLSETAVSLIAVIAAALERNTIVMGGNRVAASLYA